MECKVKKGSVFYEVCGEGLPLLVLHAMGTDHLSMKTWMEPIFQKESDFQRIYIDVPAHGKSMIDSSVNSSSDMLENLLEFIDSTFPNQKFALLGMSFGGGYLAQGIMHAKLKQVKGIALMAPPIHGTERNVPQKVVIHKDEAALMKVDEDIRVAFETLLVYQTADNLRIFMEEIHPGRLLANREFLGSNWREDRYLLKDEPFLEIDSMEQPSLFILGRQDSICGFKDVWKLLDKFPNATYSVLDQAGHLLQIEQRELVKDLIGNWLKRIQD
ncbi:alpha/beta fold hydrolase [Peribacillus alkalitolerans]|uniref:alpha/beta fold hydrolase n=1 Tax=Peribacillus alkalitolerans TaxID=1550385 RepID=UPI0013D7A81C|nr:alpha/beta hydrolase [Peribacillus alkalitolerans]